MGSTVKNTPSISVHKVPVRFCDMEDIPEEFLKPNTIARNYKMAKSVTPKSMKYMPVRASILLKQLGLGTEPPSTTKNKAVRKKLWSDKKERRSITQKSGISKKPNKDYNIRKTTFGKSSIDVKKQHIIENISLIDMEKYKQTPHVFNKSEKSMNSKIPSIVISKESTLNLTKLAEKNNGAKKKLQYDQKLANTTVVEKNNSKVHDSKLTNLGVAEKNSGTKKKLQYDQTKPTKLPSLPKNVPERANKIEKKVKTPCADRKEFNSKINKSAETTQRTNTPCTKINRSVETINNDSSRLTKLEKLYKEIDFKINEVVNKFEMKYNEISKRLDNLEANSRATVESKIFFDKSIIDSINSPLINIDKTLTPKRLHKFEANCSAVVEPNNSNNSFNKTVIDSFGEPLINIEEKRNLNRFEELSHKVDELEANSSTATNDSFYINETITNSIDEPLTDMEETLKPRTLFNKTEITPKQESELKSVSANTETKKNTNRILLRSLKKANKFELLEYKFANGSPLSDELSLSEEDSPLAVKDISSLLQDDNQSELRLYKSVSTPSFSTTLKKSVTFFSKSQCDLATYNEMRVNAKFLCTPKNTRIVGNLMTPSVKNSESKMISRKIQEQCLLLD